MCETGGNTAQADQTSLAALRKGERAENRVSASRCVCSSTRLFVLLLVVLSVLCLPVYL